MPFCSNCGTEVAEGINFCGKCGYALGSGQSTNPNPATTQTNYTASGGSGGTPFILEKNMLFRIIGKLGYIFVIIGFCIPVACDHNGFELANRMFDLDKAVFGLLMIAVFISAIVGIILGILPLIIKNMNTVIDWITSAVCIASGLIVYFGCLADEEYVKLQSGTYVILIGWIITLGGQIISTSLQKKSLESSNQKPTAYLKGLSKDIWVWLLAFTPVFSMILYIMLHVSMGYYWGLIAFVLLWISPILFIILDVSELRKRRFKIGVLWIILGIFISPVYLFARAAGTNKKYIYAITGFVLWALSFVFRCWVSGGFNARIFPTLQLMMSFF